MCISLSGVQTDPPGPLKDDLILSAKSSASGAILPHKAQHVGQD